MALTGRSWLEMPITIVKMHLKLRRVVKAAKLPEVDIIEAGICQYEDFFQQLFSVPCQECAEWRHATGTETCICNDALAR